MKLKFSTKEKKCRLCFSKKIEKILDLGNQPLANNLVKEKNIKQKKFPLKIFFCKVCKAVQLSETVNPNILFKYFGSNINRNDICGEDGWKEKINSICEYTPSKKHKKVKRKNTIRKKRKSSKKK